MKKLVLIAFGLISSFGAMAQSANDAGVNALNAPTTTILSGVSQPVSVTVKNYGTAALTSATLGFSVNGVVQPTFAWTGNVAANATSAAVTIGNFTFPAGNHTVKAWSKLPNGAADANAANDTTTISISTCTTLSGNYTINKNSAASATNFISFSAAAQALAICGVNGPVIFNVVTGTGPYNEAITLPNIGSASATNTITFNGNSNVLVNPSPAGDVLKLDGAKYFRFNDLKMEAVPGVFTGTVVSLVNAAQYNIFTGCTLTHSTATPLSSTAYAIYVHSGSSNNSFHNNTIFGGHVGIYNYGTSATITNNNNQFVGNTIKDSNYYGFYCSNTIGTVIENNDISRPTRANATTMYGIYLASNNSGSLVSRNRIHNTHDAATLTAGSTVYGIYNSAGGTAGSENIIRNNAIYNINNPGGTLYAFYNSGGNNTYYFHNTVAADDPAITYSTLRGMYFVAGSTNIKFINNNVSLTSPATSKHAIFLQVASTPLISNNNNLYVGTTGNIGYYTGDKATLADWKAANANAYDQNSVSADPQYVNLVTGNLKPNNPILNNVGQPQPAVTDDITGAVRNPTTPDPGAYEFTPVANDAALIAIISPVSTVIPGVSQPVTVTLKNSGFSNLTSATITWSVNSIAQASYSWSGNLATNQTTNVTIGNYTFPAGSYTLNVCVTNPNGQTDGNPSNDCQGNSFSACSPLTGTYTINKNAAASGTNFQSFTSAVNTLNTCGVSGPVTFNVTPNTGPYNETIEIINVAGASTTNSITFNGNANILKSPAVTSDVVIKLNGAKFTRINNLRIEENTNATIGSVILLVNAAMNNIINGCSLIHNFSSSSTSYGVAVYPGSSNNIVQNNTIVGAYYGIYCNGSATLPNNGNQFVDNTINDSYYSGIYNGYSINTLIEGNDISRPTLTSAGVFFYAIYNAAGGTGTIISKNRIHNTHDAATVKTSGVYGILSAGSGTVGSENIVKNNAIYNINNNGGPFYGIYNGGENNTYYYHNTISADNQAISYGILRGINFQSAPTNVKLINNQISLSSTAITKYAIYAGASVSGLISDNNNLYIGTGGNVGFLTSDKATLADWRTASALDQNSVSMNPFFINQAIGDLHPTTPTLNNLGQPLASVTNDITGALRNASTPDIGAFEFTVNSSDAAITEVTGPSNTSCNLTATESITITIKNYGTNTITSIPVSYSINGVAIPAPETFTGSIASNATATYTFTTKANLATAGSFKIVAKTLLSGDAVASNDKDSLEVMNPQVPGMPIALNFETPTTGISRFRKVDKANSNITEGTAASYGTVSTKGLIMDGVTNPGWLSPTGVINPWTNNPDHFSGAYICISPAGGLATDSLILTFDLKQLYKTANLNTNFRVTVNGTQVGPTYRPPFTGTPIVWQKVRVNLTPYKNSANLMIGLESSVKEAIANGTGTANLIDNINIFRVAGPTGLKDANLTAKVKIYPNPSTGIFNIDLPQGKAFELEVTDLTGKVLMKQTAKGGNTQLKLQNQAKGIYLLKVSGENGSAVRKLIVE